MIRMVITGFNFRFTMSKKNKRYCEDKSHYKEMRSSDRRKQKSQRHLSKEWLNNMTTQNLDNDDICDKIDEIQDTQWSD